MGDRIVDFDGQTAKKGQTLILHGRSMKARVGTHETSLCHTFFLREKLAEQRERAERVPRENTTGLTKRKSTRGRIGGALTRSGRRAFTATSSQMPAKYLSMWLSKVLRLATAAVIYWGAYGQIAVAQPAQNNSKPADETTKPAALSAELVFTHAEPFQQPLLIRDQRLELMNLRLWFKNEGQAPAHLLTLGTMPVLADKILTPTEEEEFFKVAATQWSVKIDGDVPAGQTISFSSQNGIDDPGWTEFQAKRKYLYSFLAVSYTAGASASQKEIVTETCIWFRNADTKTVNDCESNHNRAVLSGR
jgi:hypothetical protein